MSIEITKFRIFSTALSFKVRETLWRSLPGSFVNMALLYLEYERVILFVKILLFYFGHKDPVRSEAWICIIRL